MADLRLGITGAAGRMGLALVRAIDETAGGVLVAALEHDKSTMAGKDSGMLAGIGENAVAITCDPEKAVRNCDCIIDFSTPDTSCLIAELAAAQGCALVIGTTGCSAEQDGEIANFAKQTTIVKSGNMSLGVNLLGVLVEQAARALAAQDFDIEVLEMHHRHKIDAPSGTALLLGEAAAKGRGIDLAKNSVRVRDGQTGARKAGTIGFATLRGGSVVGDHTVILAGNGERIEFSHSAQDRSLFAMGALKAALWTKGKAPGLYSMRDVIGL